MKQVFIMTAFSIATFMGRVEGSGFAIQERSISGLGRAFSAESVMADDASVIASNPAGMGYLADRSYSIGINLIDGHFSASGASFAAGPNGIPLSADDIAPRAYIPSLYYSGKVNAESKWSYGIGVFTNFGLKSEYPADFADFAITESSALTSANVNPSVAYRSGRWSFGAGLSAVYVDAELTGRFAATGGDLKLEGNDLGFGYNLGLIYEFSERTRVGLSYRSSVAIRIEGEAKNTVDQLIPLQDASAGTKLPAILELGILHSLNEKWSVHGDIQFTQWNSFQRLRAETNSGEEVFNNNESWQNSIKFAIGATYQVNQNWTARFGAAYDETPVQEGIYRTLRIPDADRLWLSAGFSYKVSEDLAVDFGYTYVRANPAEINEVGSGNGAFVGEAAGFSHVIGVGLSGKF